MCSLSNRVLCMPERCVWNEVHGSILNLLYFAVLLSCCSMILLGVHYWSFMVQPSEQNWAHSWLEPLFPVTLQKRKTSWYHGRSLGKVAWTYSVEIGPITARVVTTVNTKILCFMYWYRFFQYSLLVLFKQFFFLSQISWTELVNVKSFAKWCWTCCYHVIFSIIT